ncbi:lysine--tRNA ligase [Candidatus Dependentiae bacterium HGW-Dependentiae-1]|nr:MAG: lysine--tRNA ligase [Candidatus Dependentiae bacterium HGW-Dependentiae-1]
MTNEKNQEVDIQVGSEHEIRVAKVEKLRALGIEPWPAPQEVNALCKDIVDEYKEEQESREYAVAGRIVAVREHGKTLFAHLQDRSGKVQLYIKQDLVGDQTFSLIHDFIDIGDIVWVTGRSFKTKTGEISLKVQKLILQSKCLYPLPEKFHGIADIEIKYRQRYLDLMSNQESRERFKSRSHIVRLMRDFFDDNDCIEVETPMLHPIPGGAAARPFVTHHNALDVDLYLRIAPELYLKRLVVGGLERVYEINRNFRNEGVSTRHNPEFTMVEWYIAYKDYNWMMDFIEKMLRRVAMEVLGTMQVKFGEHTLDFENGFSRISMRQAVVKYGHVADADLEPARIDDVLATHRIAYDRKAPWGNKLVLLFEELAEKKLIQPTFIIDFPVEISPLAKRDAKNQNIAARFELFIASMEIANGFNELNDPFDQAARFREQVDAREAGDAEAHHYDAEFVQALEYALPPTVGAGMGIDRLTMLMTNAGSIRDVILFPALKRKDA